MEAEIEISRRFKITLNEVELRELMSWHENRGNEEVMPSDLAEKLYVQLVALRDGSPVNVQSPPVASVDDQSQMDPAAFARLRQSASQGKPVIGGEWIERE